MINDLWVERYRPKTIDDYVFCDQNQKNQVEEWISNKAIPHLLFSGIQGIGKTSLAKVILNEIGALPADILELNASNDNGVDVFRDKINNFVSIMPFGDYRYVLLDEADYLTINAQAILRGVMEKFSMTARFILTCNYPHKLIPAIHSRTQSFHLTELDKYEFKVRVATIMVTEDITFDEDTLDTYIRATYPDLRKCINMMQQNSHSGSLTLPSSQSGGKESDYWIEMVELFKRNKISQARKLICGRARVEEFDNIYRFLYENLELWGNEEKQEQAIILIRDGLLNHAIIADAEINLSATLVKLADLCNGK